MTSKPTDLVTREEVLAYVRETAARLLSIDVAEVPESIQLYALPNIDSLKMLRVLTETEERYGITVDIGQVLVSRTVGGAADLIMATISEQRG